MNLMIVWRLRGLILFIVLVFNCCIVEKVKEDMIKIYVLNNCVFVLLWLCVVIGNDVC